MKILYKDIEIEATSKEILEFIELLKKEKEVDLYKEDLVDKFVQFHYTDTSDNKSERIIRVHSSNNEHLSGNDFQRLIECDSGYRQFSKRRIKNLKVLF